MRRWALLFWPAGVALGPVAEWVAFAWDAPSAWLPDLAVGWLFIACGLAAKARRPDNNAGSLMAATGFTWFLGNFSGANIDVVAWVGSHATYVHRGFLVHSPFLAYPVGRLLRRSERVGRPRSAMRLSFHAGLVERHPGHRLRDIAACRTSHRPPATHWSSSTGTALLAASRGGRQLDHHRHRGRERGRRSGRRPASAARLSARPRRHLREPCSPGSWSLRGAVGRHRSRRGAR